MLSSSAVSKKQTKNRQTKESRGKVLLLLVFPPCRCDGNNKGTWKTRIRTTSGQLYPDISHGTIAGGGFAKKSMSAGFAICSTLRVITFLPASPGYDSREYFFFCQLWRVFTKHETDSLKTFKSRRTRSSC